MPRTRLGLASGILLVGVLTAAAPPAARVDAFGDPLPPGAVARLGTVRFRHGSVWTHSVAFSPNGQRVASTGSDGLVKLWQRTTGREVGRISERDVGYVFFTANGRHLVTADRSSVSVYELPSRKRVGRMFEAGGYLTGVSLSPDGKLVAAGSQRNLYFAAVPSGDSAGACEGPPGCNLRRTCFSPDSKRLAALYDDGSVCLFDVATRRQSWTNRDYPTKDAYVRHHKELAFSPDGKTLAVSSGAYQPMRLLDAASGNELRRTTGKYHPAGPLVYLDGGKKILSGSWNDAFVVWDATTAQLLETLPRDGYTSDLALAPDDKTLAVAGGPAVRFLDATTRLRIGPAELPTTPIDSLAASPDGKKLVAVSTPTVVWDLESKRVVAVTAEKTAGGAAFAPDGKSFVVGGYDIPYILADAATGKVSRRCEGGDEWSGLPIWTRDGERILGLGRLGTNLRVWDARTGKERPPLTALSATQRPKSLAASPDGRLVAVGMVSGSVFLWDAATGKEVRKLTGHRGIVWSLAFSPNGRRLAAVSAINSAVFASGPAERTIRIWDVASGAEVQTIEGPSKGSWRVAWSPDGRTLATGGEDDLVHVWELASGQEWLLLSGHRGAVVSLTFLRDGRLASGSYDTSVLVWDFAEAARSAVPTDDDLSHLWSELEGKAKPAFRAVVSFASAGDRAVRWLEKALKPKSEPDAAALTQLVAALDDEDFAKREKATAELEKLGELASLALQKALEHRPSAELRRRAERLLEAIKDSSPGRLRDARAVEALERIATPAARRLLEKLAGGAAGARLTTEAKAALARQ